MANLYGIRKFAKRISGFAWLKNVSYYYTKMTCGVVVIDRKIDLAERQFWHRSPHPGPRRTTTLKAEIRDFLAWAARDLKLYLANNSVMGISRSSSRPNRAM